MVTSATPCGESIIFFLHNEFQGYENYLLLKVTFPTVTTRCVFSRENTLAYTQNILPRGAPFSS